MPDAETADFADRYWRELHRVSANLPALDDTGPDDAGFKVLADNIPTLCWVARGDGYIVWYNRRWHEYCGSTPESMEGWGWRDVHHPDELPNVMERWQAAIAGTEPFEMVFPLKGADGRFRPFLTRITPLRDASGEVVRWFGVNTEIGAQLRAEAALDETEAKYAVLTEAMPQMVWSTRPDGYHDFYNGQWYAFTGLPVGSTDGDGWNGVFHPDDQERAWAVWRHSLATGDTYEIEYRLRHHSGAYRWTLGRAQPVRDAEGAITRWIGTCTDIHAAKLAAEHNELLNRELSHRIKNIFAIVSGLIGLSARREPSAKTFARELQGRVAALSRAHEYARPHSEHSRPELPEMMLQGILGELFRPYQEHDEPRIRVNGVDLPVDDRGATPLALLFHELATNASKYGALSTREGRVEVTATLVDDELTLTWSESGGPRVVGEPTRAGFGTQLAVMSVEQQLGGRFDREWRPDGLAATIVVSPRRLVRG